MSLWASQWWDTFHLSFGQVRYAAEYFEGLGKWDEDFHKQIGGVSFSGDHFVARWITTRHFQKTLMTLKDRADFWGSWLGSVGKIF